MDAGSDKKGFTLVELLVVIGIFGLIIGIAAKTFSIILTQSSQQAKTADSQIEGIIGLELLRADIEQAGMGLPWTFPFRDGSGSLVTVSYTETGSTYPSGPKSSVSPSTFSDDNSATVKPPNAPRAILVGHSAGLNASDILVLKGANLGRSDASQRWSYVASDAPSTPKAWGVEDLKDNEKVIVLKPNSTGSEARQLVMLASSPYYYTTYKKTSFPSSFAPPPVPAPGKDYYLIYGIAPADTASLSMPYNRADYFISNANVPRFCAPNTGVLEKGIINHGGGITLLPLLDCVADMKVVFRADLNDDGVPECTTDTLRNCSTTNVLTAEETRKIKEVAVFILTHEGQMDRDYTFPTQKVSYVPGDAYYGVHVEPFDLASITNWQKYRWKLYRFTVRPKNLGS
jgi:prepilin-type N-terminal cleavage/methylation domain-containing protein